MKLMTKISFIILLLSLTSGFTHLEFSNSEKQFPCIDSIERLNYKIQNENSLVPTRNTISTPVKSIHSNMITKHSQDNNQIKSGENRSFWACNLETSEYYQLNASILAEGEHSCIYMEEDCIRELGESYAIEQAENLKNEFDQVIFPSITNLAGHPNGTLGDIDNDPRIVILLSRNHANYYSQVNEIIHAFSNQCEMFYIYYRMFERDWFFPTIAHEFHHLIWFNNEMDEPPFTLEALAQYATYHAGYLDPYNNIVPHATWFFPHPEDSPLYVSSNIDYGSGYLFAFYIAEHYGVNILRELIKEPSDGPHGIETTLQDAGYNITFNELYLNWITALTIDETGFQNKLYGFEGIDARMTSYESVYEFPYLSGMISLNSYGFHIHKIDSPPDNFLVQIEKSAVHVIGVSLAVRDKFGWQVQKTLHDEGHSKIIEGFKGNLIEEAYLIISYMLAETPIAPMERGLECPSTEIKISILEGQIQSSQSSVSTVSSPGFRIIIVISSLIFGILCLRNRKNLR
ncbi:MAG: hypothetical protein ACFFC7_27640 [Candidatus Hermodarchaeota archaeon]